MRKLLQSLITAFTYPYVRHELPGWGKILALGADYRRDWIWAGAPEKISKSKFHPYLMHLALDWWADRSTYFLGRWYDLETQLIVRDLVKPGSTVIDVGANRGMFALAASHAVGPHGRVICFEPNPKCVALLRREIDVNKIENISVRNVGLGNVKDTLTLTVPFQNSGSGTLGSGIYRYDIAYETKVEISVGDLELRDENPSLIKIDVEGFELNVLRGLIETIKRSHPIILHEATDELLKASGASLSDIKNLLEPLGYRGFKLGLRKTAGTHDWCLEPLDLSRPNFDAAWFHSSRMPEKAAGLSEPTINKSGRA